MDEIKENVAFLLKRRTCFTLLSRTIFHYLQTKQKENEKLLFHENVYLPTKHSLYQDSEDRTCTVITIRPYYLSFFLSRWIKSRVMSITGEWEE